MTSATTNKGKQLELEVADAYRQLGAHKVERDVEMAGNQIDVYVELEAPGRLMHRIAVEVKNWAKPVGIDVVNGFAVITRLLRDQCLIDEGIIVSASGFSKPARNAVKTRTIRLLTPADLKVMIKKPGGERPANGSQPAELPKFPPNVPATVLIPAGPCWIGSSLDDTDAHANEKPRYQVNLPAYEIGRYPVTNAQYACFLADNPHYPVPCSDKARDRLYDWGPQARIYPEGRADHPVVLVSWEDATAYCDWLSQITGKHCRLPTEEEWETAARGGLPETHLYPWGNDWEPGFCNTKELGENGTTSVHEFESKNKNPYGVIDMAGNVWEWTSSWYEPYPGSLYRSERCGQIYRVVRGGSWENSWKRARISCRGRYEPEVRRPCLGFRVALR